MFVTLAIKAGLQSIVEDLLGSQHLAVWKESVIFWKPKVKWISFAVPFGKGFSACMHVLYIEPL